MPGLWSSGRISSPAEPVRAPAVIPPAPLEASYLTAFLRPEPAVKRGTLLAAIVIVSPVRGLRPSRAPRSATWNLPKPVKLTSSPAPRAVSTDLITASTAEPASFLLNPLSAATRSTNSFFVMRPPVYPSGDWGGGPKLTVGSDGVGGFLAKKSQIA